MISQLLLQEHIINANMFVFFSLVRRILITKNEQAFRASIQAKSYTDIEPLRPGIQTYNPNQETIFRLKDQYVIERQYNSKYDTLHMMFKGAVIDPKRLCYQIMKKHKSMDFLIDSYMDSFSTKCLSKHVSCIDTYFTDIFKNHVNEWGWDVTHIDITHRHIKEYEYVDTYEKYINGY